MAKVISGYNAPKIATAVATMAIPMALPIGYGGDNVLHLLYIGKGCTLSNV